MKRRIKDFLKRQLATVFHVGQRFGVDILPRHFYSEIPDMRKLRATDHWRRPFSMRDVQGWNVDEQLAFVATAMNDETKAALAARDVFDEACKTNGATGYSPVDGEFLYAFIRQHRPARVVQVGCGISTAICLAAARDVGHQIHITCVDPYPTQFLLDAAADGSIELIQKPVEMLDLDFFSQLSPGDLFFVDSTHTLGPAGEVTRIICEMLPRLPKGVFVHFHDIYLPFDFDPRIRDRIFFWHETALLLAFLTCNDRVRVRASLSCLHHERQTAMCRMFPRSKPMPTERGVCTAAGDFSGAIYLETVG
jgi:hypothetical protein